ncbi:hypothetical protein MXB_1151, partial [Myxobolus squamalis]
DMLIFKLHRNLENVTIYVIPKIKLRDKTAETRVTESYHDISYILTIINLHYLELYMIYSIKFIAQQIFGNSTINNDSKNHVMILVPKKIVNNDHLKPDIIKIVLHSIFLKI